MAASPRPRPTPGEVPSPFASDGAGSMNSMASTSMTHEVHRDISSLRRTADCSLLIVEDDQFQRTVLLSMLESISSVQTVGDSPKSALSPKAQHRRIGSSPEKNQPSSPEKRGLNLHVEWSEDGERGWELLSSGQFHIALIDIHLPGVSGLDLSWCYSQLLVQANNAKAGPNDSKKGEGAMQQTIIIACTADTEATKQIVDQYGIHDVLKK